MSKVYKLRRAKNEIGDVGGHIWGRRAQRFLRDMRMLGADNEVIADLAYEILEAVNRPKMRGGKGAA
jgi:hypothetical protein